MADETVWLIEKAPVEGSPKWLLGGVLPSWTTDASKALKFQTELAARAYIGRDPLLHGRCWVTDHIFVDSQSDATEKLP